MNKIVDCAIVAIWEFEIHTHTCIYSLEKRTSMFIFLLQIVQIIILHTSTPRKKEVQLLL